MDDHQDTHYDIIVIGSGQAGGPFASAAAKAGRTVALIERKHIGGTCVNEGCTPTKTMVASARVAHLARRSSDYGVATGPVTVDLAKVKARKDEIVAASRDSNQESFETQEGLELIWGEARFSGPKTLSVALKGGGTRTLSAETVVINTGLRPAIPLMDGLESIPYLTSTTVMELTDVPEHLVVLGGGYIGLEFAQMFRRFGSEVTVIQRGKQLLPREDADIAEAVAEILREDGIQVLFGRSAERVQRDGKHVALTLENGETLSGSHLLVATGRMPNTDDLGLGAAGIATDDRGYISVNAQLETSVPGIYALGDVKGGPAFTHISYEDFRILEANLLGGKSQGGKGRTTEGRLVPYTVFIDPQLGRVGLSEGEARAQGLDIKVATMPMTGSARARETGEARGLMKVVLDAGNDKILGAAILGLEGGEVMGVLQVAMMGGLPYTALRDTAFAHPTLTESLNNLFMTLD
jgi:pyruvate/2-oxoglutarate dehydrogenase complex dihydrolipoamide dehydrogenase (E3) component